MEFTLWSVFSVSTAYLMASRFRQFWQPRLRQHTYGNVIGWEHLGFAVDEKIRTEELTKMFKQDPWSRSWEGNNSSYHKYLDSAGAIGILFGYDDCRECALSLPYYAARNRNFLSLAGYASSPDSYLRGVGHFVAPHDSSKSLLFAEMLGYRSAKSVYNRPVVPVAVSFYLSRLRVFPQGQRPDAFNFKICSVDDVEAEKEVSFSEQTLFQITHPQTQALKCAQYAIIVGNVIASGEHLNAVTGRRFFYATVNTGSIVVDLVLDSSRIDSPLEIGSFVAGDGRLVAEIID